MRMRHHNLLGTSTKRNPVVLFTLVTGLLVLTAEQTKAKMFNKTEAKGVLKRNVFYQYVSDRPRLAHTNLIQGAGNIRSRVLPLLTRRQRIALTPKYRRLLGKLYARRRSDINSPLLLEDIPGYNKKQSVDSPDDIDSKQLNDFEPTDVNKKYASRMESLGYYPESRTSISGQHIELPQENYQSPLRDIYSSSSPYEILRGHLQQSPEVNEALLRPFSEKEHLDRERYLEEEELRELEELRGK